MDRAGNLYSGGDFTNIGEAQALRVARWDGAAWHPLGNGIGAEGDYSTISALVVDDSGNLYVGGQFTLAGSKPSAYLAKWCVELETGSCTFTFQARVHTPQPTPVLTTPAPLTGIAPPIGATEPGLIFTLTPTNPPEASASEGGIDLRFWLGAGVSLTVLLGGLFLFFSRRS